MGGPLMGPDQGFQGNQNNAPAQGGFPTEGSPFSSLGASGPATGSQGSGSGSNSPIGDGGSPPQNSEPKKSTVGTLLNAAAATGIPQTPPVTPGQTPGTPGRAKGTPGTFARRSMLFSASNATPGGAASGTKTPIGTPPRSSGRFSALQNAELESSPLRASPVKPSPPPNRGSPDSAGAGSGHYGMLTGFLRSGAGSASPQQAEAPASPGPAGRALTPVSAGGSPERSQSQQGTPARPSGPALDPNGQPGEGKDLREIQATLEGIGLGQSLGVGRFLNLGLTANHGNAKEENGDCDGPKDKEEASAVLGAAVAAEAT
eukprot:NODE_1065_length_1594_cov_47.152104_g879_i0.p1 GENE.NODE_1065_length_1594_cov_47.152104_g879_i0~~NODE_1065_length_1594_cov_47.152104_g879_i0.p1  ORF type:complete len:325 (+),score=75.70 NODE_1065_length_1594_cov_47.152104_g879_i0:25-975(+)